MTNVNLEINRQDINITANLLRPTLSSPWVDVRDYPSFSAAIDAIGASEETLLIPNEQAVTADKTSPANVTPWFTRGGSLNISAGKTVTINGHVKAGLYRIFKGDGDVSFGAGSVKEVYYQWWGAIQPAIDAGYDSSAAVIISGGTHNVTGLKVYPYSTIVFLGDARLKMTALSGFVISTKDSPTAVTEYPTNYVRGVVIEYPKIDMDKKGDAGIWLECANTCKIVSPEIYNVPSITFNYDDGSGFGLQTYEKCAIALKSTTHTTPLDPIPALYNRIEHPFLYGAANGDRGEVGILLTTTGGQTTPKSNYNAIIQPRIRWFAKGIFIEVGNDNYIEMPELSNNTVGIDDDSDRTLIIKPYLEYLTEGIDAVGATNQLILGNGNIGTISGDKHKNTGANAHTNRWIHNEYQAAASVYLSVDQTVTHNTTEILEFDTKEYDLNTLFSTGTYKFTVKDAGLYKVFVSVLTKEADECSLTLSIRIDTAVKAGAKFRGANSDFNTLSIAKTLKLAVGKEITATLYVFNHIDSGNVVIDSLLANTYMAIERVIC